jgi:hypothetical protein
MRRRRLEKVDRALHVVAQVQEGAAHRLPDLNVAGEMKDRVEAAPREELRQGRPVGEVADDQFRLCRDGGAVTMAQIVEDDDAVAGIDECADAMAADIAGATCDEDGFGHDEAMGSWRAPTNGCGMQ